MNRSRAKELLPIIQAFAEGEVIQILTMNDEWTDRSDNIEFIDYAEYRIKPEPMEVYIRIYDHGNEFGNVFRDKERFDDERGYASRIAKFREITDE